MLHGFRCTSTTAEIRQLQARYSGTDHLISAIHDSMHDLSLCELQINVPLMDGISLYL